MDGNNRQNIFNFYQGAAGVSPAGAAPVAQGPYGSTFLNDVHRIFPAFLYTGSQFNTMFDVFNYIQRQMAIHFNSYNNAQNEYIAGNGSSRVHVGRGDMTGLIQAIFAAAAPPPAPSTAEYTRPYLATETLASPCAVCLANIVAGENVCELRACGHSFHTSCIEPWFMTSMRCPMCRNDIRLERTDVSGIVTPAPTIISTPITAVVTPSIDPVPRTGFDYWDIADRAI
jgi:hypothetical protein